MSEAPVHVRAAELPDADAVWPLVVAFATSYRPERDAFDAAFPAVLADANCQVLVAATPGGSVVGYVLTHAHRTFFANGPVAWVEELMVHPRSRRLGVGRTLLYAAEQWARSVGAAYVSLATRRAAPFYEAVGYEESATFFRRRLD